jgi:hypothetical protein
MGANFVDVHHHHHHFIFFCRSILVQTLDIENVRTDTKPYTEQIIKHTAIHAIIRVQPYVNLRSWCTVNEIQ